MKTLILKFSFYTNVTQIKDLLVQIWYKLCDHPHTKSEYKGLLNG